MSVSDYFRNDLQIMYHPIQLSFITIIYINILFLTINKSWIIIYKMNTNIFEDNFEEEAYITNNPLV